MRIFLQTPVAEDQPPRYYHIFLQKDMLGGWSLVREWGFQGSPGRVVKRYFGDWDEALQAALGFRDAQVARGYRVMFVEGQSPAAEPGE